jgi:hypothetical protein
VPKSPRPFLTPELFDDRSRLADEIYAWLLARQGASKQSRTVLRAQAALRRVLNNEQWRLFLVAEAAITARDDDQILAVVRWAFQQGRQYPRSR